MADSTIEWTDATWNPVAGCAIITAGCTNCYRFCRTSGWELVWSIPKRSIGSKLFAPRPRRSGS